MVLRRSGYAVLALSLGLVAACSSSGPPAGSGDGGIDPTRDAAADSPVLGTHRCRTSTECGAEERCAVVVEIVCGGAEAPSGCTVDGDCADGGADRICVYGFVACETSSCRPKCRVDTDCAGHAGSAYGDFACQTATGRCIEKTCGGDADCRTNFTCQAVGPQGARVCRRKPCTVDADCRGACVERQCGDEPGTCVSTLAPP